MVGFSEKWIDFVSSHHLILFITVETLHGHRAFEQKNAPWGCPGKKLKSQKLKQDQEALKSNSEKERITVGLR